MTAPFTIVVLAAQRAGRLDPLAERAGVSHKCLAPIAGKPMLQWVVDAIADTPGVGAVRICIEPEAMEPAGMLCGALHARGIPVAFIAARATITDSAYAAARDIEGAFLITTGDNVNMTAEAIQATMAPVFAGGDVALALASRETVLAARGETVSAATAHVGPYRFRDGRFSNCNLYAMRSSEVLHAAETFREGGQFSKDRGRLIRAVGLINVALVATRLVTLDQAMALLSRRFGMAVKAVRMTDGRQAVDVDNARTYALAETMLLARS